MLSCGHGLSGPWPPVNIPPYRSAKHDLLDADDGFILRRRHYPGITMRHFLLAAALFFTTPALADVIPGSEFKVGYWEGGAQTAPGTKEFKNCYATIGFTGGESLWLNIYQDDVLEILLSVPGTTFTPGQPFKGILMTEVGSPWYGEASAVDENYAGISFIGVDQTIDFLTQGVYLRLLGIGIDNSFDTRGIGGALGKMQLCMAKYGAPQTSAAAADPPPSGEAGTIGTGPGTIVGEPKAGAEVADPGNAPVLGTGLETGRANGLGVPAPRPKP
jgi:hypothetical protein